MLNLFVVRSHECAVAFNSCIVRSKQCELASGYPFGYGCFSGCKVELDRCCDRLVEGKSGKATMKIVDADGSKVIPRSGKWIMICLESLTWGWAERRHLAFLETSPVSDIKFWKPVYQLFKPDEPLMNEALRDFYVRREDSPVDGLVNLLGMDDTAAKFLLGGHRGGGKTTELRRLEQRCAADYTVVWVDTDAALDKFNIGHAEVTVLIGMQIVQQLATIGWTLPKKLEKALRESLTKVTYQDKTSGSGQLELPKVFQDLGVLLRVGFQKETTRTLEVKPVLGEIVDRVNDIIAAAQTANPKLLVIVDGLDRKEYSIALEMFSSSLLTDLNCHIVYTIPIALRYSASFKGPMESFTDRLDFDNVSVFKCDDATCPMDKFIYDNSNMLNTISKLQDTNATYSNF